MTNLEFLRKFSEIVNEYHQIAKAQLAAGEEHVRSVRKITVRMEKLIATEENPPTKTKRGELSTRDSGYCARMQSKLENHALAPFDIGRQHLLEQGVNPDYTGD